MNRRIFCKRLIMYLLAFLIVFTLWYKGLDSYFLDEKILTDLTFQCSNGELGNRMMYYAVVYGLSRLNNRSGFIQKCNIVTCRSNEFFCKRNRLSETFYLTLPVRQNIPEKYQIGHNIHVHPAFPDDKSIPQKVNILVGEKYPVSVEYFLSVREEIRKEFRFKEEFTKYAQSVLLLARGQRQKVKYVGIHVRRTTYIKHLRWFNVSEAPPEFYKFGISYFRSKYPDPVFLLISDDLEWCRKNFKESDIYIPDHESSPEEDLAVLSQCNHTIFDYGTFGFWAGFLAGGETMYYINGITDTQLKDPFRGKLLYPPDG